MSYDGEVSEDDWCIAHACMKSRCPKPALTQPSKGDE